MSDGTMNREAAAKFVRAVYKLAKDEGCNFSLAIIVAQPDTQAVVGFSDNCVGELSDAMFRGLAVELADETKRRLS